MKNITRNTRSDIPSDTAQQIRQAARAACRETVKKRSTRCQNREAGELEGARPASNWISERPKMPISGIFGYRILPSGKIRARKAQSKKSQMDFFDKLKAPGASPGA